LFELSIALKYLIPKRNQLSVSLIALMSVAVISLVVWLLLVFFSVSSGIERGWLQKLTAVHAPLKITPKETYFSSYYYQVDTVSAGSGYKHKTIGEKRAAPKSDPYDTKRDMELPSHWPEADRKRDGELRDPVKLAVQALGKLKESVPDLKFQEFEVAGGLLKLEMQRREGGYDVERTLTQAAYVTALPEQNPKLPTLLTVFKKELFAMREGGKAGIVLPKSFQDSGVRLGDTGTLTYASHGSTSVQEGRAPVIVSGFYDPGAMSIGVRCLFAPPQIVRTMHQATSNYALDKTQSSGIQVWFSDLSQAKEIQHKLAALFEKEGIDKYWQVASYHEYDFAKDLLQQFKSDKTLFTLVGVIVLLVACCNIISLLVMLVSDKKKEIGILQAMGASRVSIAAIFGLCGTLLGLISSGIGIGAALLTLRFIDKIAHFLSALQGHEMFNATFYGNALPNALSSEAILFVLVATPLLALLAGLIPALRASRVNPSTTLKSL
jgi:lipoprotein-releasing system permease protein